MFSVELYKGGRLIARRQEASERDATTAIDALITAVHRGQHGHGDFRVNADRVNDLGMLEESLFDSDTFAFPVPERVR